MEKTIGFIGGGRIVRILVAALARKGFDTASIVVSESSPEALSLILGEFPKVRALGQAELASVSDIIFLALHPAAIAEAIGNGRLMPRADAILVSLAPKVAMSELRTMLGGFDRIARMIPNAPSIVGSGYNPTSYGKSLDLADSIALRELFAAFGDCPEVEESKLEAYAVLTAMGPTYFLYQIYEVMRIAGGFGLEADEIAKATRSMLEGTVATIFDSRLEPERVLDLIPGKPMAPNEATIKSMYDAAMNGIYTKLKS
jgi:pyrroline-5-carboxylate reductase